MLSLHYCEGQAVHLLSVSSQQLGDDPIRRHTSKPRHRSAVGNHHTEQVCLQHLHNVVYKEIKLCECYTDHFLQILSLYS